MVPGAWGRGFLPCWTVDDGARVYLSTALRSPRDVAYALRLVPRPALGATLSEAESRASDPGLRIGDACK